jgi:hypothetical protein
LRPGHAILANLAALNLRGALGRPRLLALGVHLEPFGPGLGALGALRPLRLGSAELGRALGALAAPTATAAAAAATSGLGVLAATTAATVSGLLAAAAAVVGLAATAPMGPGAHRHRDRQSGDACG